MAVKPTETIQWAVNDIDESKTINGSLETLPNKQEPTQEFANSGVLFREPLPRPYLNFFFNLTARYINYLEERADEFEATLVRDSINNAAAKTALVDADVIPLLDSAATNALKKITWANVKTSLPDSSETVKGVIELATEAEGLTGTDAVRAITAAVLKAVVDAAIQSVLETGTKTVFYQEDAPTGWTKSTAVNDRVIQITSGSDGGTTGGSWTISGLDVLNHTLSINEIPSHDHRTGPYIQANEDFAHGEISAGNGSGLAGGGSGARSEGLTSNTGGTDPHDHGISSAGTWRPAHAKFILCTRD